LIAPNATVNQNSKYLIEGKSFIMKRIVNDLVKSMKAKGLTIALAESVTCGLASHQLNIVKGTSEILIGSVVCYNEKVKTGLLGISPALVKNFTAESQEVTEALAKNLNKIFAADIYVAITGLAAPGASETKSKPVGTIFFSIFFQQKIYSFKKRFYGSPLEIKRKACRELYQVILERIKNSS
jgi:nicotinamide-nucleotide amidase